MRLAPAVHLDAPVGTSPLAGLPPRDGVPVRRTPEGRGRREG